MDQSQLALNQPIKLTGDEIDPSLLSVSEWVPQRYLSHVLFILWGVSTFTRSKCMSAIVSQIWQRLMKNLRWKLPPFFSPFVYISFFSFSFLPTILLNLILSSIETTSGDSEPVALYRLFNQISRYLLIIRCAFRHILAVRSARLFILHTPCKLFNDLLGYILR